jgi:hypothetical protein
MINIISNKKIIQSTRPFIELSLAELARKIDQGHKLLDMADVSPTAQITETLIEGAARIGKFVKIELIHRN